MNKQSIYFPGTVELYSKCDIKTICNILGIEESDFNEVNIICEDDITIPNLISIALGPHIASLQHVEVMPIEVQEYLVSQTPEWVRLIKNPDTGVVIVALQSDGELIQFIDNPTADMKHTAISQCPNAIGYIKNQTPDDQIVAIANGDFDVIRHIHNPSDEIIKMAISKHAWAVNGVKHPTEEMYLMAVNVDPQIYNDIPTPSDAVSLSAVKHNSNLSHSINKLTYEMYEYAKKQGGSFPTVRYRISSSEGHEPIGKYHQSLIDTLDYDRQVLHIRENPDLITKLKNPSYALRLEALRNKPLLITQFAYQTSTEQLFVVDRYKNASDKIKREVFYRLRNPSDSVISKIIDVFPEYFYSVHNPSDEILRKVVELGTFNCKYLIDLIKDNEELLSIAIGKNPHLVMYIPELSEDLEFKIVSMGSSMMYAIYEPTDDAILYTVKTKREILNVFGVLSPELQMKLLDFDLDLYPYLKEPTEEATSHYAQSHPHALSHIYNPSDDIINKCLKTNGYQLYGLQNPSEEQVRYAIMENPEAIRCVDNPSTANQVLAVSMDPWVIQFINNPSEEAQKIAVSKNHRMIVYLDNPSEEVQLCVTEKEYGVLGTIKNPTFKVCIIETMYDITNLRFVPPHLLSDVVTHLRSEGLVD